jgi:hypothetical protein
MADLFSTLSIQALKEPVWAALPRGTRLERWSACGMAADSPLIKTPNIPRTASKVSQSQI